MSTSTSHRVAKLVSGRASQLDAEPKEEGTGNSEQIRAEKRRIAQLERALGRKTYELEIAGELSGGWE
jgi:hypothetical protein